MNNKKEYNIMSLNCYQICHYRYGDIIIEGETFRVNVDYFISNLGGCLEPVKTIELFGDARMLNFVGMREMECTGSPERSHIERSLFNRIIYTEPSVIEANKRMVHRDLAIMLYSNDIERNNIINRAHIQSAILGFSLNVPDINLPLLR